MNAIPFDTHGFIETLCDAGVPKEQAIAHKDALTRAAFATGGDIDRLEAKIEKVHTEMQAMEHRIKLEMIKWMVGIALAQTAIVVGLVSNLLPG